MALKSFNSLAGYSVGNTGATTVIDSVGNVSANFLAVTSNSNLGNYATANFFSGDGGLLTNISATTSNAIANGTSNVRIPTASGNINLSVGGTSNVLIVTSTGVNVTGTLNATGNANTGNIGATTGVFTNISGTLTGSLANGTSNVSIPAASGNVNISANAVSNVLVIADTGITVSNASITNITSINAVSNGTSYLTIPTVNANVQIYRGGALRFTVSSAGTTTVGVTTTQGITNTSNLTNNANILIQGNIFATTASGALNIYGNTPTTANTVGGEIGIFGGTGSGTGSGGNTTVQAGNSANGSGGNLRLYGGNTTIFGGIGGAVALEAGTGYSYGAGVSIIAGGATDPVNGWDGNILIATANLNTRSEINLWGSPFPGYPSYLEFYSGSGKGTDVVGGDTIFNLGVGTGTGTPGQFIIKTANVLLGSGNTSQSRANRFLFTYTGLNINAATNSTSTTTGALIVGGGVGITGNLYAGGIANITGNANVGNLGTTGNITAGYYFGNGSQLTGISATTASALANGTSNVSIPASGGNVNTSVGGVSNVFVVTSTGANITGTLGTSGNTTVSNLIANTNIFTPSITTSATNGNLTIDPNGSGNLVISSTTPMVLANSGSANTAAGLQLTGTLLSGTSNYGLLHLGTTAPYQDSNVPLWVNYSANDSIHVNYTNPNTGNNTSISTFWGLDDSTANYVVLDITRTSATLAAGKQLILATDTVGNIDLISSSNINFQTQAASPLTLYGGNGTASFSGNIIAQSFANGNSNIRVIANSNIAISAIGNANIFTVTGTGVNVSGTLNATGNANTGNIGATTGVFTNISGTLTGTLANGTSNINIVNNANINMVRSGTTRLVVTNSGVNVTGAFSATSKSFLIQHPINPEMHLQYGSLESPYHGVRLTGEATVKKGKCVIILPDYIRGLIKQEGAQVQLTNYQHGRTLYVDSINVDENMFIVKSNWKLSELKFFWSFTGIRKDVEDLVVEY